MNKSPIIDLNKVTRATINKLWNRMPDTKFPILCYKEREFVGVLYYNSYDKDCRLQDFIIDDYVIAKKNVFNQVRKRIRNGMSCIPIMDNISKEIFCFAINKDDLTYFEYDLKKFSRDSHILTRLKRRVNKICLNGCDEKNILIFDMCKCNKMSVELYGSLWKYFLCKEDIDNYFVADDYVDKIDDSCLVLNINDYCNYEILNNEFIYSYEEKYLSYVIKTKQKYNNKCFLVSFPSYESILCYLTENEKVIHDKQIDPVNCKDADLLSYLKKCISESEWDFINKGIIQNSNIDKIGQMESYDYNGIYTINDGFRCTIGNKVSNTKKIYMLGSCELWSRRTENKTTIASFLQKLINDNGEGYNVKNCGIWERKLQDKYDRLLWEEDCIVICDLWDSLMQHNCGDILNSVDIDISEVFAHRETDELFFYVDPSHATSIFNSYIARKIWLTMKERMVI